MERTTCQRPKRNILSLRLLLESGLGPAIIIMGIHPNIYPITIMGMHPNMYPIIITGIHPNIYPITIMGIHPNMYPITITGNLK